MPPGTEINMMELLLHQCGHGELKRLPRFVFETDGLEGLCPRNLENHPPLTMTYPLGSAVTPEFVPVQVMPMGSGLPLFREQLHQALR